MVRPQTNKAAAQTQGRAPGVPRSEPASEATPAVRSAPGFLLSARKHVKVWVRVFSAPPPPSSRRSIRLDRGVAKSGREGRRPAGNRFDRQPRAVGAGARSGYARRRAREGKKRDFQKLKRMHRSHPLDPPPKPDLNLADLPSSPAAAGLPKASVTRNTLQPEREMLTFQTKARWAPLPGR